MLSRCAYIYVQLSANECNNAVEVPARLVSDGQHKGYAFIIASANCLARFANGSGFPGTLAEPNSEFFVTSDFASGRIDSDCVVLRATRFILAGEEIFTPYGPTLGPWIVQNDAPSTRAKLRMRKMREKRRQEKKSKV